MKRRPSREIEIFSLSAIDLFAAAMGAFALLTIVLMPFYQKEIRERTPENAIADLLRAAENSVVATEEQRKAFKCFCNQIRCRNPPCQIARCRGRFT